MAKFNNGIVLCQCSYRTVCSTECKAYRTFSGKLSNADKIRSMNDEEMANFLQLGCCRNNEPFPCSEVGCKKCWLNWLKECDV